MMKVLLIGLDGATWDLIKPWVEEGELPTFRLLMKNGVWGKLRSTIPCITVPAWPALYTGKNPGKFGVIDFVVQDRGKKRLIDAKDIRTNAIWDYLSLEGFRSCILNIPVTYPPRKINGCIVSSLLTPPGSSYTYPESLGQFLDKLGYKIDLNFGDKYGLFPDEKNVFKKRDRLFLEIRDILTKRIEAMNKLVEIYDFDFLMVNFKMIDVVQHLFWDAKSKILDLYKIMDNELRYLLNLIERMRLNAYMLIVSDHGFHESAGKVFNLIEWLTQRGYLPSSYLRARAPVLYKVLYNSGLYTLLLQTPLYKVWKKIIKKKTTSRKRDIIENSIRPYRYWGISVGNDKLKKTLINDLRNAIDPQTGKRIFIGVFDVKKLHSGPHNTSFPNVVYLPHKEYRIPYSYRRAPAKLVFKKNPGLPGSHEFAPDGIFLAYGKDIKKGYKVEGAKIYDLTPTILHIFNLPIPSDMDGKDLKEIFKPDSEFIKRKPSWVDPSYYDKKTEEEKLRTKIKDLKLKGKI